MSVVSMLPRISYGYAAGRVERVTTLPAPMVQCLMYFSAAPYLLSLHPVLQLNLRYAGKVLFVFSNQNEAVCNGCRAYQ